MRRSDSKVRRRVAVVGIVATTGLPALVGMTNAAAAAAATTTVAITSPASGASLTGVVTLTATATTTETDGFDDIDFYDGSTEIDDDVCTDGASTCQASVDWDTTTTSKGSHTLTAVAENIDSDDTTSPPITVTVDNPGPDIAITAPTEGAAVSGVVPISVTATDSGGESVDGIVIYEGDDETDIGDCDDTQPTCQVQFDWDTTGLYGAQVLTAQAYVDDLASTLSAPVTIYVQAATKVVITSAPHRTNAGKTRHVHGALTVPAATDEPTLAHQPVRLDWSPTTGVASSQTTTTNRLGNFSFTFKPKVNGTLTVSYAGANGLLASDASQQVRTYAPMKCHAKKGVVRRGRPDRVTCQFGAAAEGTAVRLIDYRPDGHSTLTRATVRNGRFSYAARLRSGDHVLVLDVAATPYFVRTKWRISPDIAVIR